MIKLILLTLAIIPLCHTVYPQDGEIIDKGLFKVTKIDNSFPDFHLIFIQNHETNYTIYSEKTILVPGQKIKKGQEYYFELVRKIDTLATGQIITPINYLDISHCGGKYLGTQTGMICYERNLSGLIIPGKFETKQSESKKTISGIFTQKTLYRYIMVEFKEDKTFNYQIMSHRAHQQTSGKYEINGKTIILNSNHVNSVFGFVNKRWRMINKRSIVTSEDLGDIKNKAWSILEKSKYLDSIPTQRSDLSLRIDSIKIHDLDWSKDTINHDLELILLFHEPSLPQEPIIIINGIPVKYNFLINYFKLSDVESITSHTVDELNDLGIHGGHAMNGLIIISTKNKKRTAKVLKKQ